MTTRSKRLSLVLAGAVFLVGGLWLLRSQRAGAAAPRMTDVESEATALIDLEQALEIPPRHSMAHQDNEAPEMRAAIAARAVEQAPDEKKILVTISARFVDRRGSPLGGVELSPVWLPDAPVAVSDGTGLAELRMDWEDLRSIYPGARAFMMQGAGLVTRGDRQHFRAPEDRYLGEFSMQPGGKLVGRVVDQTGLGVRGATVYPIAPVIAESTGHAVFRVSGGQPLQLPTLTDAVGGYTLDGLPGMACSIVARGRGTFFAMSEPVAVAAGETLELPDLALESVPLDELIGGVVRTQQGAPVSGAILRLSAEEGASFGAGMKTDELGLFDFPVLPGKLHALRVRDNSARGWPDVHLDGIEPGTTDLEIVFLDTSPLLVRAVGPDGRPVGRFQATIRNSEHEVLRGGSGLSEYGEPLELRQPAGDFSVTIRAPRFQMRQRFFRAGEADEDVLIMLEQTAGIAGRVTAGGKPVVGALVDAHRIESEDLKGVVAGVFHVYVDTASPWTDHTGADGEFFLNVPGPTRASVHAWAVGFARASTGLIDIDPEGAAELLIELIPGGSVAGRVLVGTSGKVGGRTIALSHGDSHFHTTVTNSEGFYRLEELRPGRWQIAEVDRHAFDQARQGVSKWIKADKPTHWDFMVEAHKTTHFDLDLTVRDACRFEGQFLVDGESPKGWTWSVPSLRKLREQQFDLNGKFQFAFDKPGKCQFLLGAPRTPGAAHGMRVSLELFAGMNSWEWSLRTGTLELISVHAPPLAEMDLNEGVDIAYTLVAEPLDGVIWFANVFAFKDGKARLISVPSGRIRLFEGSDWRPIGVPGPAPLRELTLGPGKTLAVDLD